MAKGRPVRINRSRPHKVGNRMLSDYDLGFDLWYTRKPLPLNASPAMQQGFVNAAKNTDKLLLCSMKWQCRRGNFVFLGKYAHLEPNAGNPLAMGCESRLDVRRARAAVKQVRMAANL